jgi:glycosyltransferase involved in cell wall biosynthesis
MVYKETILGVKMKVAIYSIAKNEEQFVKTWYESAKDADYLLIADTGSTDNTVDLAKSLGINVFTINIMPWRFDDARNASLSLIPADIDYCIALDMDEVILPGWRENLEEMLEKGITRPRYQYTWNWNEDGTPGLQYGGDKIHSRKGYHWKHPVHEVMNTYGGFKEIQGWTKNLEIHHHADTSKPRSSYLPLLAMSVEENPEDDRNAFYYGRELFFYGRHEEAEAELKRHLSLPTARWLPERAASMRYIAKCKQTDTEEWFLKAIAECPGRREAIVDLAFYYYNLQMWDKCFEYSSMACAIKEKPLEYLCEAEAWGALPHDLMAISAFNMGKYNEAVEAGTMALELQNDKRLRLNLEHYKKALSDLS